MKKITYLHLSLLIFIPFFFISCDALDPFRGTEVKESDLYIIDFYALNEERTHDLNLVEGDTLDIKVINQSGSISIFIYHYENDFYYERYHISTQNYAVAIPYSGTYTVAVAGTEASGFVRFKVRE
jgi:hypothetical protein